jgi:phenylalanyl-tRNA synthetase beta chain
VDPEIAPIAVARFLELLQQMIPDVRPAAGRERRAAPPAPRRMPLRIARYRRVVGADVPAERAAEHLEALGFGVERGEPLTVTVPSWRPDVTVEDDLVEEVARSVGYDAIPERPLETAGAHAARGPIERLLADARRAMLARGLHEAWCTTLVSEREAQLTAELLGERPDALVRLANPMSRESEVLRPNLVAGLLRACALNLRQGSHTVRLFEVGTAFAPRDGLAESPGAGIDPRLPVETPMLAAIVTGAGYAHAHGGGAIAASDSSLAPIDSAGAKGLWEAWLEELRVDSPEWRAYAGPGWKPGASAEVASRASRIGWAGTLGPSLLREWGIESPVHLFTVLLEPVLRTIRTPTLVLPGKYPPVRRDLAFFVPESVAHLAIERAIVRAAGERLASIELFDVYAGPGTPSGTRSMAYALQFQHPERTMTEPEVQAIHERIVTAVARDVGGRLRER